MEKIKFKGNIWYAGDNAYIERFDPNTKNWIELDLVEFLKNNVEDNSKIILTIEPDN